MIVFWFLITALAVYRTSRMLAEERGPYNLFAIFRGKFITGPAWLTEGIACTFCWSFWIAFLFCLPMAVEYNLFVIKYILLSLACSAITVMVHRYFG